MAESMQAFVMREVGEVGIIEKAVPQPGPNEAVVKMSAALVCTADTHTVAGGVGERLMRLVRNGRVDPTLKTTHRFSFGEIERAFRLMQTNEDGVIKPLISFG